MPFANHAFVLAVDPTTGASFATCGGPGSGRGTVPGAKSRQLVGLSAPRGTASFPDALSDVNFYQVAGTIDLPIDEFAGRMNDFAQATNNNDLSYTASTNSNSYVFTFVQSLGFERPTPAFGLWAPGSSNGVPAFGAQCRR